MEFFKLVLIGIGYLVFTLYCGRYFLKFSGIKFESEILNFVLGFLVIEAFSYISFMLFGTLGLKSFVYSFLPNILVIFAILAVKIFHKDSLQLKFRNLKALFWPCCFLFLAIAGVYLFGASEHFMSVLNFEGVIYQDIIYHGGIVNSIINFGYPVQDPQFYNQVLNYHFFTHFLTAKISYLTGANAILGYHFFLNIIGILFYSILSISVSNFLLQRFHLKEKYFSFSVFAFSFIAFFCVLFLGGRLNAGFVFNFFFSASFQWQLFLLLVFYFVVMEIVNYENYSKKNLLVFVVLLFVASITKISSLPLMIAGILSLCIYYILFYNKRFLRYWGLLGILYVFSGILIFSIFFAGNKSESSLIEFNLGIIERLPLVTYFNLTESFVLLIIFLLTTVSYRFVLFLDIKNFNTWFSGAILLTGFVLSLSVKADQAYFLFPSLIISSHLSLSILWNIRKKKFLIILALPLIILSFYPIASLGLSVNNILSKKDHYYPINYDRLQLYKWLNNNTNKNEIIFTSSVIGSPGEKADNFYPAALSKRIFYLGGYRFGGLENRKDFQERFKYVNNFDINSARVYKGLKAENINFILIEKIGNSNDEIYNTAINVVSNDLYQLEYKNKMGLIFSLK